METSPKISVIVPVYKAEKYIRRCLDSIVAQTFTNWECILVDDGSPDNSGKICDEYAERDGRFRVIHQANAGVSAARQKGLENCIGEYVIHTDPDDWVEDAYLEKLYEKAKSTDADIVMCDFEKICKNKIIISSQKHSSYKNSDLIKDILEANAISGVLWNKLIRRDSIKNNNVKFLPQMNLSEDVFFICSLLLYGIKVVHVPMVLYHYDTVSNPNSFNKKIQKTHIISRMILINELSPKLTEQKYATALYKRKAMVKYMIFAVHCSEFDLVNTYSEINKQYINNHNLRSVTHNAVGYIIALYLKGHKTIANIFYCIYKVVHNILSLI